MRVRPLLLLLVPIAIAAACGPVKQLTDPEPKNEAAPMVRSMLAVRIAEDGRIEVNEKRIRDAKKLPLPQGDRVWITAVSAPTAAALASLTAVAEEALERHWLVSARVRPSPASGAAEPKEKRSAPPPLRMLTIGTDGNIAVPAGRVRPEDARNALPDGRCEGGTAIGLVGAGTPADLFRAAGYLSAAGCEVLVVLPGATIRP